MITIAAVLLSMLLAAPATSPAPGPASYDSPKAAADALVQAVAANDVPALLAIFGPLGEKIVTSADKVKDENDRETFTPLAREKMDVEVDAKTPRRAILTIGTEDWPFPVAIVETNKKWQ